MNEEKVTVSATTVPATTSSPKKKYPNQIPTVIPETKLFEPSWPNRHTRRARFGGMSAPDKAGGVKKNPQRRAALEGAALAYIQEKVTCKVWEIPVRPETSSEHRALIRLLEREGKITRDPFNPGYVHALAQEDTSNHSEG